MDLKRASITAARSSAIEISYARQPGADKGHSSKALSFISHRCQILRFIYLNKNRRLSAQNINKIEQKSEKESL